MQVDPEFLKTHYASLSDEAFDDIDRGELTGVAQKIYDEERGRREPSPTAGIDHPIFHRASLEPDPDWLEDAACACSFRVSQGQYDAAEAEARQALEAAGIPVHMETYMEEPAARATSWTRLMIPSRDTLRAESVLDREIYNPQIEDTWRTHLSTLSDREFRELDFEGLIAGLTDRIERLRRAYKEEVSARR